MLACYTPYTALLCSAMYDLLLAYSCVLLRPGVHLAYYCVATLVLTSLACSLVDVVERLEPLASLLDTRG